MQIDCIKKELLETVDLIVRELSKGKDITIKTTSKGIAVKSLKFNTIK